ncbi:protein kinase domain-containing protein [Calothrix sp. UHCC 0171]|uniref:protein kinase domain-containing protein n=1 Tax=Calothrix sp. UHCC 0171 TaxID=3110245 RepID=UPI002B1F9973|nr:IMS domain-containing protein [Calothrix sp. UHCC 0171]MEA5571192.1 IMS domain-containing protein [Calothrix sp. UHCC 0171]
MLTPTLLNNRYRVLRVLGDGGFGETFLAEDTQMPSGRRCVIKQLKPVANNPQVYQLVQERFRREAAILEELGNGCNQIPTLYAYFVENGEFYLVQEYIEGQTLTQILQQGLLSESSVKEILINILPVLDYVHSKGIVHRDIKPDNILIRNSDRKPVLIDFGAVKETMGTTVTASGNSAQSIVIGTPGFMPMEQSVGRPVFASDIYSLGLTAIYLLTGKIPQEFTTNPVTGEIVWRNFALGVTPTFAGILDKSIQPIGRDRYWNAREMLSALQAPQTPPPPTAPIYPVAAPTVPSSPPPQVQTPTLISPPTPQYAPTAEAHQGLQPRGLGTWQQAIIIGGVIGIFVVSGLWVMQLLARNSLEINPNPPNPNLTPTASQTPTTPIITSPPPPVPPVTSIPPQRAANPITPTTSNPASISQNSAEQTIRNWLTAKRDIFGSEHHAELGVQLLTGKAFRDNIRKTDNPDACIAQGIHEDNCLSSVDWLIRNNAYYSYGVQKIEQIRNFSASGDNATIEVDVTEERTLYKNGKIDRDNTAFKTSRVRYSLVYENGLVKISDYKTLN